MTQLDLFTWTPPVILGDRDGTTYEPKRDRERLDGQMARVFHAVKDGQWRTLSMISSMAQAPEASVSARLRDLRRPKFGGYTVERRYIANGLFEYRVVV